MRRDSSQEAKSCQQKGFNVNVGFMDVTYMILKQRRVRNAWLLFWGTV